jgi:hypothetical protein
MDEEDIPEALKHYRDRFLDLGVLVKEGEEGMAFLTAVGGGQKEALQGMEPEEAVSTIVASALFGIKALAEKALESLVPYMKVLQAERESRLERSDKRFAGKRQGGEKDPAFQ